MKTVIAYKLLKGLLVTGVLGILLSAELDCPPTPHRTNPAKVSWITGNVSVEEEFSFQSWWHHLQMLPKVAAVMVQPAQSIQ